MDILIKLAPLVFYIILSGLYVGVLLKGFRWYSDLKHKKNRLLFNSLNKHPIEKEGSVQFRMIKCNIYLRKDRGD